MFNDQQTDLQQHTLSSDAMKPAGGVRGSRLLRSLTVVVAAAILSCAAPAAEAQSVRPPNVIAAANGEYNPAPGYRWVSSDSHDLRVRWTPGVPGPLANVVASPVEGQWAPAAGYRWVTDKVGDLRVVRIQPQINAEAAVSAAAKILLSHLAVEHARSEDEGDLISALAIQIALSIRDEAVLSAMNDLFPGQDATSLSAARHLLCLGIDGKLTASNLSALTTRDIVMRKLRSTNPDMANTAEIADFITNVVNHPSRNR